MKSLYGGLLFLFLNPWAVKSYDVDVAPIEWNGVAAYLVVDKNVVQVKLDDYQKASPGVFQDRPLYVPDTAVFPGFINSTQHVVYFNFGYLTADEFDGVNRDLEVTVNIPLLASCSSLGPPSYSLAVAKFYQRGHGDMPRVSIAYPYYPADEISISKSEALIRIGDEKLRVSFNKSDPCETPDAIIKHEFTEFVLGDVQVGAELPDFSYCDRHDVTDSHFCRVGNELENELKEWKYQICQQWVSADHTPCVTSLKIEEITPRFREILLVGDSDPRIIASEHYHGHYTVKMTYPC